MNILNPLSCVLKHVSLHFSERILNVFHFTFARAHKHTYTYITVQSMMVTYWAVITSYHLKQAPRIVWNINYLKWKRVSHFASLIFFYFRLKQFYLVLIIQIHRIYFSSNLFYGAHNYSVRMHSKHYACSKYPWEAQTY